MCVSVYVSLFVQLSFQALPTLGQHILFRFAKLPLVGGMLISRQGLWWSFFIVAACRNHRSITRRGPQSESGADPIEG